MGRPSLAEPRRRQIVDALRATIVKHGLAGASVQRIAAEAGVPAGLIHHYFASKEDLLIATVDQVVEDLRAPLMAELDVLDPDRALARALDFLFIEAPAERMRSVLFAEIGTAALRRPQLRKRIAALNAEVVKEIAALLDRLPDRRGHAVENEDLATAIACLFIGADGIQLFDTRALDPRRLRRLAGDVVARARGMQPEAPITNARRSGGARRAGDRRRARVTTHR
jgi:TetR/AcrR family transcriptional regulator, transcriptional repressor of bet genes